MTKKILNLCFAAFVFLTIYTFLTKKEPNPSQIKDAVAAKALVTIDGMSLRRYRHLQITSELHADLSQFVDPNAVELYGNIRGMEKKPLELQASQVASEFAFAIFEAQKFNELLENSRLEKVFLEDSVEILHKNTILTTEQAEYHALQEVIETQHFVDIRGPGQWLTGSNGLKYNLSDENLEIFGTVEGQTVTGSP